MRAPMFTIDLKARGGDENFWEIQVSQLRRINTVNSLFLTRDL
jgi:hypothetical protein